MTTYSPGSWTAQTLGFHPWALWITTHGQTGGFIGVGGTLLQRCSQHTGWDLKAATGKYYCITRENDGAM